MRDDNRGFSLLEMIIVLAILSVLIGFFIAGLGYIFGTEARGCANVIKTAVGSTRITTMGREETLLRIYRASSGGAYFKQVWVDDAVTPQPYGDSPEQIGKSYLEIVYWLKGEDEGQPGHVLDETADLFIGFDRSSGAETAVTMKINGVDVTSQIIKRIDVSGGGRTYTVGISPATGKVYLE